MRTGLTFCLVGLWALIVAAIVGPQAGIAEASALFLAGLLLAVAVWLAWEWVRETMDADSGAPYESNAGWAYGLVLCGLVVGLALLWEVCIATPVRRFRQLLRKSRDAPMDEAEFQRRAKALEGRPTRLRW